MLHVRLDSRARNLVRDIAASLQPVYVSGIHGFEAAWTPPLQPSLSAAAIAGAEQLTAAALRYRHHCSHVHWRCNAGSPSARAVVSIVGLSRTGFSGKQSEALDLGLTSRTSRWMPVARGAGARPAGRLRAAAGGWWWSFLLLKLHFIAFMLEY